nr:nucleotide exchange factor GrpE [Acaryochloris sp. 'Moss Beach']
MNDHVNISEEVQIADTLSSTDMDEKLDEKVINEKAESGIEQVSETEEPPQHKDGDQATLEQSTDGAIDTPTGEVEASSEKTGSLIEETRNQAQLAELSQQIIELKTQLTRKVDQYTRLTAEYDNFRKRTNQEKEDLRLKVKCSTISDLLPVVDNFERAKSHIHPQTEAETSIHNSYQSIYKQLEEKFKQIGVSAMECERKDFDPNLHEALLCEPTDQASEGTILEELVRGYVLGDCVLRHAKVKVAVAPKPAIED